MWLFQYKAVEYQVFKTEAALSLSMPDNTANPDLT